MRITPTILLTTCTTLVLTGCYDRGSGEAATRSSSSVSSSDSSASSSVGTEVVLLTPTAGSMVTSPIKLSAKAPGTWFFEASIPVELIDANENVLASGVGQVEGGWMTVDLVKFDAEIPFTTTAKEGFFVIKKDNPSGLPENDKSVRFPVKFN